VVKVQSYLIAKYAEAAEIFNLDFCSAISASSAVGPV